MTVIEELRTTIKQAEEKIERIQNECSHPSLCLTTRSNKHDGSRDPGEVVTIWKHCSLCDKSWKEQG